MPLLRPCLKWRALQCAQSHALKERGALKKAGQTSSAARSSCAVSLFHTSPSLAVRPAPQRRLVARRNPGAPGDKLRALHRAVLEGNSPLVVQLLQGRRAQKGRESTLVNQLNAAGHSALTTAAANGNVGMVQLLVEAKADVNVAPLASASLSGRFRHSRSHAPVSPLAFAAQNGHLEMVKCLVEQHKAIVNPITHGGHTHRGRSFHATPLMTAAQRGQLKVVEYLVQRAGAQVDLCDVHGHSPLMSAAMHGQLETTRYLVQQIDRLSLHCIDDVNSAGDTALHLAALSGHTEVLKCLIEEGGADASAVNYELSSPLSLAALRGHEAAASYLLRQRHSPVDANRTNAHGTSPLMLASIGGALPIVKDLVEHGNSNVNWKNIKGETALMLAALGTHIAIVEYLLRRGAQVDLVNAAGENALMLAANRGVLPVVKHLVEVAHSPLNRLNTKGFTAVDLAVQGGHESVAKYLLEAGADAKS